jgi:hypothetical protein
MKTLFTLFLLLLFLNCQKEEERCGQIIQKVTQDSIYYFILQTDDFTSLYGNPNMPGIPDDGIRQGSVSKEVYESFEVGEEYCSEI